MVSYTNLVIKKSSEMYELGGVLAVKSATDSIVKELLCCEQSRNKMMMIKFFNNGF
jgi:hypothetical protein